MANDAPAAPATTSAPAAPVTSATPAPVTAAPAASTEAVPPATTEAAPAAPDAPVVPEKYVIAAPEGREYNPETLKRIETFGQARKLSQADMDELMSIGGDVSKSFSDQLQNTIKTARTEWVETAKADPEIGGAGFDANVAKASDIYNRFGSPELGEVLKASGLGDHPEIVRWALRVSKALSEDTFVAGGNRGQSPTKDPATVLYGTPNS